jgi:cleavage and polyadenylation specificity factor subunit 1
MADLGDLASKSPYLIVSSTVHPFRARWLIRYQLRAANDDLTIYEPFRVPSPHESTPLSKSLHFLKVHNPHLAKNPDASAEAIADKEVEARDLPMRALRDIGGYTTVFLPGGSPSFILKSSTTIPKVLSLRGAGVRGFSGFHTAGCDRGFIYVDTEGVARVSQLPPEVNFTEVGMPMQKIKVGQEICALSYHPPMDIYILGTSTLEEFELPKDDDYHKEWQREDGPFKPLVERSFLKVMSPSNWSIIDTIELEVGETITCIKTVNLETSEVTHERRQMVAVGTAVLKGEDLAIRGCIYVFDVVIVVPEPGRPETNKRLKLVAKEEIARGGVTGVSEIGTQGCMVIAQGQKLMVRGLKEDGTLLPVAFMDMNTYVTSIKELPGTGLCVLADALKGVWFAGYSEEPYKMTLFGKQTNDMEVVAAEVLPIGKELYIVAADSDCNLHILQFDPDRRSPFIHCFASSLRCFVLLTCRRSQIPPRPTPPPPHHLLPRRPPRHNNDAPPAHKTHHYPPPHTLLPPRCRLSNNPRPRNSNHNHHRRPPAPLSLIRSAIPTSRHRNQPSHERALASLWTEPESS